MFEQSVNNSFIVLKFYTYEKPGTTSEAGKLVKKLLYQSRWEVAVALASGVGVRVETSAYIWGVGSMGLSNECGAERDAGVKGNNLKFLT